MSEPYTHLSTLLLSDVILVCSFVFSHPLYSSYFIFFSPYLFRLISFLSPLFITTLLLVLALLTRNRTSLVPVSYISLLEKLSGRENQENEFHWSDDFDVYEIVFGSVDENQVDPLNKNQVELLFQESESSLENGDSRNDKIEEDSVQDVITGNSCTEMGEKRLENFLKILGKFERMSSPCLNVDGEKKSVQPSNTKTNEVVEKQKAESTVEDGSDGKGNKGNNDFVSVNVGNTKEELKSKSTNVVKSQSQRVNFTSFESSAETLTSYGSMRKEKEWKRTLACKLFEERHNGNGREGMDSLWETYEIDSVKGMPKNGHNKINKNEKKDEADVFEDEGHDGDEIGAQLCCLQVLKLSGKTNLGMKKPSLVKISKAIKGLGWLHGVTKHSKKVHNSGDRSY